MFIKVALCLLWYLFCARLLVDAVLLAVIYAAFSRVCDCIGSDSDMGRGGEGRSRFNGRLTAIRLPTQSMTPFRETLSNQSRPIRQVWM